MSIPTRAAVLSRMGAAHPYADSRPLSVETVTLVPPGPGEVLVAIKAAGLCHSDLSVINGDRPRPLPMALGHEAAGVKAGQSVVVIGLGGVGLSSVLGALASGASPVVAVDRSEDKLALARTLGPVHTVNGADPDAVDQVRALTNGGADFAFEMAGSVRALDNAWKMTRRGGTTVTAGLPPPDAALAVNIVSLVGEERTLKGSYIGTCVPSRDIPRYVALYRQGRLPVDRLMSGVIPLDDINAGFDRLHAGEVVRLVVRP